MKDESSLLVRAALNHPQALPARRDNPQSTIVNPQSVIRNRQSPIRNRDYAFCTDEIARAIFFDVRLRLGWHGQA
jgi:hypothetical protein